MICVRLLSRLIPVQDNGRYQPCAIAALLARMQALRAQDGVGDTYQEDVIKNAGLAAFEGICSDRYNHV